MRAYTLIALLTAFSIGTAWSHEGGPSCDSTAAKQPSIERARDEVRQKPRSLGARMELADELVDIGCYDEAVHLLEDGAKLFPADRNLQTRLRTARSFVGEREYLAKRTAASGEFGEAAAQRLQLRCKQLGDVEACDQALANKPNEAALWVAKGDALLKSKRSREALAAFTRAKQLNASEMELTSRINAVQALLAAQSPPAIEPRPRASRIVRAPAVEASQRVAAVQPSLAQPERTYSNVEPAGQSN